MLARPPAGWGTALVPQWLQGGLTLSSCRHGVVKNGKIQKLQEEASVPRDLTQVALLSTSVSPALRQGRCLPP